MKTLIVDDELQARKRIANLLIERTENYEIEESSNGRDAIEVIKKFKPELIFLDINLLDISGFQVLKGIKLEPKPIVIFVTAHEEHAIKAFDHQAFDFLLKPFKDKRFFQTLDKVRNISSNKIENLFEERLNQFFDLYHKKEGQKTEYLERLAVKKGNKTILINVGTIQYINASGNYVEIFTAEGKQLVRGPLNHLSCNLDPDLFVRIHRSTVVNVNFIQEIIHSDYSEIDLKLKNNTLVRVSKSHKKEFLKSLGI
jgi:two-component system LytT family response regulator